MKFKNILCMLLLVSAGYSHIVLSDDHYVQYLKPLFKHHKKDMKVNTDGNVSTYIKTKNNRGGHYVYVLIYGGNVVYCGITNDPSRREDEHQADKVFDSMVAAGKVSENSARDFEKRCVCKYSPAYNKRPTCPITYVYGGNTYYIE